MTIKFPRYTIKKMGDEAILKEVESRIEEIEEHNKRVASELSLLPNSPDKNGRNKVELAGEELERTRPLWEDEESEIEVGKRVVIKAGTPVGLGSKGYVAGKDIEGSYEGPIDFGLYGGAGLLQHGNRRRSPYVQIAAALSPREENGILHVERVNLRVPLGMFEAAPQESTDNSSIAA